MDNYINMDEYFEYIFGYKPKKQGTGYELLVAAVLKILNNAQDVTHNIRKTGLYSKDKYQIDALVENKIMSIFVECKDYVERNKPTPRKDIATLAGSLNNLDINTGILASATGFTKPTVQYAESTKINPNAKEIELFLIRPSNDKDTEGLIMSVCINLDIIIIDHDNSKLIPIIDTEKIQDVLNKHGYKVGDTYEAITNRLYREDGTLYKYISEIANDKTFNPPDSDGVCRGCYTFDEKVFLEFYGEYIEVYRLDYEIRHKVTHIPEFVKIEDKALLKVESIDKKIDRIITEKQLKSVVFNDDGTIEYRGRY